MNVKQALISAYEILTSEKLKEDKPIVRNKKAVYINSKETTQALKQLIDWVYPEIESDRLKQIIPCSKCQYYRKMRNKTNPRKVKFVCKLDRTVKRPDFYCASAVEKE